MYKVEVFEGDITSLENYINSGIELISCSIIESNTYLIIFKLNRV